MASPTVTNSDTQLNGAWVVQSAPPIALTNAQMKALPTTPIQILAAPGAGKRIKVLGATLYLKTTGGAYTNINTVDANLVLTPTDYTDPWLAQGPANDGTLSMPLTAATDFLAAVDTLVYDFSVPAMYTWGVGAKSGNRGQLINTSTQMAVASLANKALFLSMDNNGSGNLTGGSVTNAGLFLLYYAIESTL